MTIDGKALIQLGRVVREAGREIGRNVALGMNDEQREAAAADDFQDEACEACVDYGLMMSDETENLCAAFTSAFVGGAVAVADSKRNEGSVA